MKRGESREMAIGAVALLVLGVLLGLFQGGRALLTALDLSGYRLHATFNRIDGLNEGAPVYVSGIRVGEVQQMSLAENNRARVTLWIRSGYALPVGTAAAIHTEGVFGSKFMILDPGGADAMLQDGDTITFTQDALIVSELLELIIAQGKASRAEAAQEEERGN